MMRLANTPDSTVLEPSAPEVSVSESSALKVVVHPETKLGGTQMESCEV